jgi:hypothetical protein
MSFIKKDKENGISDYDLKHLFIEDDSEVLYKMLKSFNPLKKNNGIIVPKKYKNEVKEIYSKFLTIEDEEIEEVEEDEENSESSDDELIQEVLQRRLKSESENLIIEEDKIDNSDDEDVISLSRRLRFIYKELQELKSNLKN